jgi:hypothetical protein
VAAITVGGSGYFEERAGRNYSACLCKLDTGRADKDMRQPLAAANLRGLVTVSWP